MWLNAVLPRRGTFGSMTFIRGKGSEVSMLTALMLGLFTLGQPRLRVAVGKKETTGDSTAYRSGNKKKHKRKGGSVLYSTVYTESMEKAKKRMICTEDNEQRCESAYGTVDVNTGFGSGQRTSAL